MIFGNKAIRMVIVRVNLMLTVWVIYATFFVVINPLTAQVKNYIGIETTLAKDLYDYSDLYESAGYDDADLLLKSCPSYTIGVNWGWSFNNNMSIEMGCLLKQYTMAFGFNNERDRDSKISESFGMVYRFPIRLRYQFNLIPDKLYFISGVGISAAFDGNMAYHSSTGSGSQLGANQTNYDYYYNIKTLNGTLINPFWFIEGLAGFTVPLGRTALSLQASMVEGLNQVHTGFFSYNSDIDNIVQRLGTLKGSGNYIGLTISFVYQLKK